MFDDNVLWFSQGLAGLVYTHDGAQIRVERGSAGVLACKQAPGEDGKS